MKESGRHITLTGMMKAEGGQRNTLNCVVTDKDGKLKKFHPLAIVSGDWEKWYIEHKSIKLALQVETKRTQTASAASKVVRRIIQISQLDTLAQVLPEEKKRGEWLWEPVFSEYRRIGYRLRKEDKSQPSLFEGL